jgi:hypothetical protein
MRHLKVNLTRNRQGQIDYLASCIMADCPEQIPRIKRTLGSKSEKELDDLLIKFKKEIYQLTFYTKGIEQAHRMDRKDLIKELDSRYSTKLCIIKPRRDDNIYLN